MQQIRVQQLAAWLADDTRAKPVLLDVREPWELELCQLAAFFGDPTLIPYADHA